jgi:hypothetical protein
MKKESLKVMQVKYNSKNGYWSGKTPRNVSKEKTGEI